MKLETTHDQAEWMYAAQALAVVSAYHELGVFERLAKGPVRVADLGLDARAVKNTLPLLRHVGLVCGDDERVALTDGGRRALEARAIPTGRNLEILRDLSRAKELLEAGGPVKDDAGKSKGTTGGTRADDPDATKRFLDMLYDKSEGAAKGTFAWLSEGLSKGARVLDLGGGHGRYARAFADAGYEATLLDLPHAIAYAKARHGDALRYQTANFHEDALGGPYDLALLSNIVHSESDDGNAKLFARLFGALAPGGRVAIKDMFLDELEASPENAVFFGVTMLLYTERGRSPSLAQLRAWLSEAGFEPPTLTLMETHALVVATKKA